jgi:hypothetical protein
MELLRQRHAKDVLVEECKLGESWGGGARRLDAWAMLKSWSPWTVIGYELKQSRQDFTRDEKWVHYLEVCHYLYFVCPWGLIKPEELPPQVGLLWAGGSRLQIRRKAERREPDPVALCRLMSYVLMSRTRIVSNMYQANDLEPKDRWRLWLAEKLDARAMGHAVSRRLLEQLGEARAEARRAKDDVLRLEGVARRLDALGLPADAAAWQLEERLAPVARYAQTVAGLERSARRLADDLATVGEQMRGSARVEVTQNKAEGRR